MNWQKKARLGLAVFVVVLVAVVAVTLRTRKPPVPSAPLPQRTDPNTIAEAHGGGTHERTNKEGRKIRVDFTSEFVYPDGRAVLRGVKLTLPERDGKTMIVTGNELEKTGDASQLIGKVRLTGNVHLTANDGLDVRGDEATYDDNTGTLIIPGTVTFSKGRMAGSGVGATYDRAREVLWINDQARVTVTPDVKGQGGLQGNARAAGLARADHYLRLTGDAHVNGEGRDLQADEITVLLADDNERVRKLELRANSRITGSGSGGPQTMSARDIDLTYADDGRTLQRAQLVENAVVGLPGTGTGKRVAGRTIDIGIAPDGSTVTSLTANENVQVDLPPDGDSPAKRILSATLVAGGGNEGLQNATFGGNVDYRETRAARRALPAINRTARAITLVVKTQPGFGAIEQAEFSGNVRITDGTDVTAEAPHAVYAVTRNAINLSPGTGGEPGPTPRVSDRRIAVDARTIAFALDSRKLNAETRVRSSMKPEPKEKAPAGRGGSPSAGAGEPRVPSMLEQDKPVNVTANRLDYDGGAGRAVYNGNARLWQGDTSIDADSIVIDDTTGNLDARIAVKTKLLLDEVDAKTGKRQTSETNGTADAFLYEDERRLATYTGSARMVGPEGDVKGDKIELFLKKEVNELERAEGYGHVEVKESDRTATGNRLTYTAATQEYFMTGEPVVVVQRTPPECKKTTASSLKFRRAVDTIEAVGVGPLPLSTNRIPCTPGRP